jgi:hypothetical protein
MNNFKQSCIALLDKMSTKVEQVERDFKYNYPRIVNVPSHSQSIDRELSESLELRKQHALVCEKEQKLTTIVKELFNDLRAHHNFLRDL